MFKQGDNVTYINGQVANHIVIEMVTNGTARSTSGQFADLGPFSMTFDATTGEGTGEYVGTRIVKGHRKIASWHQLAKTIDKIDVDSVSYSEVLASMYWFVAMQEAEAADDMNRREIGDWFLNGIKPMSQDRVDEWLDIYYESTMDDGDSVTTEDVEQELLNLLNQHFNTKVKDI